MVGDSLPCRKHASDDSPAKWWHDLASHLQLQAQLACEHTCLYVCSAPACILRPGREGLAAIMHCTNPTTALLAASLAQPHWCAVCDCQYRQAAYACTHQPVANFLENQLCTIWWKACLGACVTAARRFLEPVRSRAVFSISASRPLPLTLGASASGSVVAVLLAGMREAAPPLRLVLRSGEAVCCPKDEPLIHNAPGAVGECVEDRACRAPLQPPAANTT